MTATMQGYEIITPIMILYKCSIYMHIQYAKSNTVYIYPWQNAVDGSEIPFPTTWDGAKTLVNNGMFTDPNLNW